MQDDVNHAMTNASVAIARMDAHERTCTERYTSISNSMSRIDATLAALLTKLDDSARRVHERIDGVAAEGRSNANLALSAAQDAAGDVKNAKIWALTGLLGWLIAALGWLGARLFGGHT